MFIHTDAYDQILKQGMDVYDELFDAELGAGGWSTINAAHYAHIAAALDAHRGEGIRVVITYGAAHKYWFLEQLVSRTDVVVLSLEEALNHHT